MSILKEFRETESALKIQQAKLKALEDNEQLARELEFDKKLAALMKRYGIGIAELLELLRPPRMHVKSGVFEQRPVYGNAKRNSRKNINVKS